MSTADASVPGTRLLSEKQPKVSVLEHLVEISQIIWVKKVVPPVQALRLLGEASYATGEYDAAISYWDRAITADPSLANGLAPVIKDLRMYQGRYGKK